MKRVVVGIVGDVTAGLLLAAPGFTFWKVVKEKDVKERTCYPYLATLLNCICWVLYGIPQKNWVVVSIRDILRAVHRLFRRHAKAGSHPGQVNVIRTKDKSNMSPPLAICSFANSITWTIYALLKPVNWYILIPNALGFLCASVQIVVYLLASLELCCFKQPQ